MHELNITESLAKEILTLCAQKNIHKPRIVSLNLGELTTYKKDQIEYFFDTIKGQDELLKNVELNITELSGIRVCKKCHAETPIDDITDILCPHCHSNLIEITQGKEFNITAIEY